MAAERHQGLTKAIARTSVPRLDSDVCLNTTKRIRPAARGSAFASQMPIPLRHRPGVHRSIGAADVPPLDIGPLSGEAGHEELEPLAPMVAMVVPRL
jgi:hypothetical protein